LLAKRLRQFERAGLIERIDGQYVLTVAGKDLEPVVFGLGAWGARWAFEDPADNELDAELLVWWIHTRLDTSMFPGKRHVLHFRFTDDRRHYWVVIENGVPSVCLADPGFEPDVTVTADVATLYKVWLGRLPLKDALRSGQLVFEGVKARVRCMPAVLRLSPAASLVVDANG
jgi:alkyl sulfatase BDS1-like metallo-beta-lactamase superfamily hydrolase